LKLYVAVDNKLKVISNNKKLTDPIEAPRIKLFDGRETFASNRGYIWSRTIPMLKDTLILGYGPDTYPMVFPQEDYVGRFNVGNNGMLDILIDKPHNMYLQTAINTGVISLFALLAIWGTYLFDSFKIYVNGNIESFAEYMGAATFLSITAYLVAGLFNDNIISVAPLFWILLGMGIGINSMIKAQN
jgi:O-antigen ligase